MVFSDLFFLFVFVPAFMLCYLLAAFVDNKLLSTEAERSNNARNSMLVIFSLVFYAWGEPVYVFLMLGSVFINYLSVAKAEGARQPLQEAWHATSPFSAPLSILVSLLPRWAI